MKYFIDTWAEKIKKKGKNVKSSLWDFKLSDGKLYFTIDPNNIPKEWKDLSNPQDVFEVPEVWYGVAKAMDPLLGIRENFEVEFCKKIWEKYGLKDVKRVFEVCCGISPHGVILAREGIEVVGVDASSGMVKAANIRAKVENIPLKAYRRDVFRFSIPGDPPDAAILLGGSFPLPKNNRIDNTSLVSQIRSVGSFLKKGAIYIIDCGTIIPPKFVEEYVMEEPKTVNLKFAKVTVTTRYFPTDPETLSTYFVTGYDVEYPDGKVRLEESGVKSFISPQHLKALLDVSKIFTLEAFHHWGDISPNLKHPHGTYIAVLRRK